MQIGDILSIFQWWFVLLVIGVGFFPVAWMLFRDFFDLGYAFAKIIGTVCLTYAMLVLGTTHLAPFTPLVLPVLFLALSCLGLYLSRRFFALSLKDIRPSLLIFVFEEVLFLLALFAWSYVRSFAPDIHGLEKYMDFGFVNSLLRSQYFPPKDMWLAPYTINYYYFGHLMTALLTKLSGIPAKITFNLMIATLFALAVIESFSLGATFFLPVKKALRSARILIGFAGSLSFLLVTLSGNLHVIYSLFLPYKTDNPVPPWKLVFSPQTFPNGYWYPNATRFIYHTIHEFPTYSWVVSDLHGHVLDVPIVLTGIALIYILLAKALQFPKNQKPHQLPLPFFTLSLERIYQLPLLLVTGFLLAVMYMTNAWDGFIYFLLACLTIFTISLRTVDTKKIRDRLILAVGKSLFPAIIIGVSLALFSLPFSYFFDPSEIVGGIGVMCAPQFLINLGHIGPFLFEANHCQQSPWWQLLILYGFFYFFVISLLIFLAKAKKLLTSDIFVLLLIILATLLIIIPEFAYIKDIYPTYYRANTMFKLVFQSFIMLSLASAYTILRILTSVRHIKRLSLPFIGVFGVVTILLLIAVFSYPYFAVSSYYNNLQDARGLDGTAYLKTLYPNDYQAINWLNAHVAGQPVILEAQGDSYTDYARVSANTGLPTVLGWTVHEWLWRGNYGLPAGEVANPKTIYDVPAPRITEVQTLYETSDPAAARRLLAKYHIAYVFVGALEYQKYPLLNAKKFQKLGHVVFTSGTTEIYKIDS